MSIIIQKNASPERVISLVRRNGYYAIEVSLEDKTLTLHTETNKVRAEGVYYYLIDNAVHAVRQAREAIEDMEWIASQIQVAEVMDPFDEDDIPF